MTAVLWLLTIYEGPTFFTLSNLSSATESSLKPSPTLCLPVDKRSTPENMCLDDFVDDLTAENAVKKQAASKHRAQNHSK
jgi:hypothetical protein